MEQEDAVDRYYRASSGLWMHSGHMAFPDAKHKSDYPSLPAPFGGSKDKKLMDELDYLRSNCERFLWTAFQLRKRGERPPQASLSPWIQAATGRAVDRMMELTCRYAHLQLKEASYAQTLGNKVFMEVGSVDWRYDNPSSSSEFWGTFSSRGLGPRMGENGDIDSIWAAYPSVKPEEPEYEVDVYHRRAIISCQGAYRGDAALSPGLPAVAHARACRPCGALLISIPAHVQACDSRDGATEQFDEWKTRPGNKIYQAWFLGPSYLNQVRRRWRAVEEAERQATRPPILPAPFQPEQVEQEPAPTAAYLPPWMGENSVHIPSQDWEAGAAARRGEWPASTTEAQGTSGSAQAPPRPNASATPAPTAIPGVETSTGHQQDHQPGGEQDQLQHQQDHQPGGEQDQLQHQQGYQPGREQNQLQPQQQAAAGLPACQQPPQHWSHVSWNQLPVDQYSQIMAETQLALKRAQEANWKQLTGQRAEQWPVKLLPEDAAQQPQVGPEAGQDTGNLQAQTQVRYPPGALRAPEGEAGAAGWTPIRMGLTGDLQDHLNNQQDYLNDPSAAGLPNSSPPAQPPRPTPRRVTRSRAAADAMIRVLDQKGLLVAAGPETRSRAGGAAGAEARSMTGAEVAKAREITRDFLYRTRGVAGHEAARARALSEAFLNKIRTPGDMRAISATNLRFGHLMAEMIASMDELEDLEADLHQQMDESPDLSEAASTSAASAQDAAVQAAVDVAVNESIAALAGLGEGDISDPSITNRDSDQDQEQEQEQGQEQEPDELQKLF